MRAPFLSSFFTSVVPPPKLLALMGAGLEVSDHSVKFLTLARHNGSFEIALHGSEEVAPGVIMDGEIKDAERLGAVLRTARSKIGTALVSVSLPEQKGYLFQVHLDASPDLAIRETLEFTLEEHVPLAPGEAVFDYEIVSREEGALVLNVTAFPRKTVEGYYDTLARAGFSPLSFEMESQAAARAVTTKGNGTTVLAVDFGETRTAVSIIERGIVRFTTSLDIAGAALMNALQKALSVDAKEAERLKNTDGLTPGTRGGKVAEILMPTISALRDEVSRHFIYWHTHVEQNEQPHSKIEEVLLFGGNANLRGLPEYLAQSLNVRVRIPDVWGNVCDFTSYVPPIPRNESLRFATVVGLALRAHLDA